MTLQTLEANLTPLQLDHPLKELRQMIDLARQSVATTVNVKLTMLYWHIGNRIYKEILNEDRGTYGKSIVSSVSQQLTNGYRGSFIEKNLRPMIQFAEIFSDQEIVVSLIRHLTWTHFIALIPIKDPIKRDFYGEMCRLERWNVKTLRKKIDSMLFERTALSKRPELVKDDYAFDFLELADEHKERELERAILNRVEDFLREMGHVFSFIAKLLEFIE